MTNKNQTLWAKFKDLKRPTKQIKLFLKVVTLSCVTSIIIIGTNGFFNTGTKILEQKLTREETSYPVIIFKVPEVEANEREYEYNEQIEEEAILLEMKTLAERFNIDEVKWEKLLRCEATCVEDYCEKGTINNLATNKLSTALGCGQYLIGTWQQTESYKQFKKARTDYKASLWEMALDLSQGEQWRWQECLDITGITF